MKLFAKFVNNQAIKLYRLIIFPFRKLNLMVSKNVMFGIKGYADMTTSFGGDNYVGQQTFLSNCSLGRGTYVGDGSRICNMTAGKFCSVGFNVTTAIGTHPVRENIATSPSMFSTSPANNLSFTAKQLFEDATGPVVLENDVWIGNGAILMAGITVGNGAVIGAGSVVTKSVKPYEIWAGVPAKQIGKRFSDEEIDKLLDLKWWDRDDEWLRENAEKFANPKEFLSELNK